MSSRCGQLSFLNLHKTNSEGNLPFLDLNIKVSEDRGCNLQLLSKTNRYWDYTEL